MYWRCFQATVLSDWRQWAPPKKSKCEIWCFFIDCWSEKYEILLKNTSSRNEIPLGKRSQKSNISKSPTNDQRSWSKSDLRVGKWRKKLKTCSKLPLGTPNYLPGGRFGVQMSTLGVVLEANWAHVWSWNALQSLRIALNEIWGWFWDAKVVQKVIKSRSKIKQVDVWRQWAPQKKSKCEIW